MKWNLKHRVHGDKPWAVQAEAMRRADGRERYGFHLEQGLGKSPLTFNEFLNSDADLMVVIAPNSFKGDWPLIPEEWGQQDIVAEIWPGRQVLQGKRTIQGLIAINYEAIRSAAGRELQKLMHKYRVFLVIDESTAIKGPRTQTSKAVHELAKDAYMVRVLNGTPLVQNCMDLFMPLKCLGELDGMNPFQFRNRFAVMGGYMGKQIKGLRNEDELYRILDRCAFRALKADWRKDLPPKLYTTVHVEMTAKQRRHYAEMMEEFFTLVNDMEVSADMVLIQLDKLRQISSCLVMQDGHAEQIEEPKNNPKLQATLDIINGGPTKVIVPYFYRHSGQMLVKTFADAKLNPAWIRGGMSSEDIIEAKQEFNEDPACRVLVGQIDATSRGHTLIGGEGVDRATRMIFFENSFSLMHRLQIEDRIHRGAQDQDCQYFDISTSPIDDKVSEALRNKKALADSVDEMVKVVREGSGTRRPPRAVVR